MSSIEICIDSEITSFKINVDRPICHFIKVNPTLDIFISYKRNNYEGNYSIVSSKAINFVTLQK